MITSSEAIKRLVAAYPELTVVSGADYSSEWFIFDARKDPSEVDYNSSFYAVNKKTGDVCNFAPTADLDGFFNAYEKRRLRV